MIIGIDNGIKGGLCAITRNEGKIVEYAATPTLKRKGKHEVDICAIAEWIENIITPSEDNDVKTTIVIEEPLKHAKSSQSIRSMGISFGQLMAVSLLYARDLPINLVCLDVRDWQKPMLGKVPRGKTKEAALKLARSMEPDVEWLASKRCRVPHDGIVDAFLIAHFQRNYENRK